MKPPDDNAARDADRLPDAEPVEDADPLALKTEDVSYFGYTERPFFERLSAGRFRLFRPLLVVLHALRIRSNHITGLSFLIILIGFPILFWREKYLAAFIVLGIHIILDGIDGPLARLEGSPTPSGALLDMGNDVTGMVIVVITASHWGFLHPTIGFMYVVGYLYLTFAAIAQNALGLSFRFVMKTKYPVYILLAIRAGTGVDITTWFCIFVTAYMATHVALATGIILEELDRRNRGS